MPPLVSILVPTYRRPHLVVEAIQSAQLQAYPTLEILVGEDAAGDGDTETRRAVERLAAVDRRIRFFSFADLLTQSGVLNRLFAEATGDYVQFLDDDDLLHPQKLLHEVGLMEANPDISVTGGFIQMFRNQPGDQERLWNATAGEDHLRRYLQRNPTWVTVGMLFRRTALEPFFPVDVADGPAFDLALTARVLIAGGKGKTHPHLGAYYRISGSDKVSNLTAKIRPAVHLRLFRWAIGVLEDRGLLPEYRDDLALTLSFVAFRALHSGDITTTLGALTTAISLTPEGPRRTALDQLRSEVPNASLLEAAQRLEQIGFGELRDGWWGIHSPTEAGMLPYPKARRYGRT